MTPVPPEGRWVRAADALRAALSDDPPRLTCEHCKGTGEIEDEGWMPEFAGDTRDWRSGYIACGFCDGDGWVNPDTDDLARDLLDALAARPVPPEGWGNLRSLSEQAEAGRWWASGDLLLHSPYGDDGLPISFAKFPNRATAAFVAAAVNHVRSVLAARPVPPEGAIEALVAEYEHADPSWSGSLRQLADELQDRGDHRRADAVRSAVVALAARSDAPPEAEKGCPWDAEAYLDAVIEHGDEMGHIANALADELRDVVALAAARLRPAPIPATEGRREEATVKLPWVVYDAVEEDWYCFATETEAVTKAQQIIDSYGGDSWPDAIDEITVMRVTHAPVRTVLFEREGMTDDEWYAATGDDGDHDTWVTYDMRPVAPSAGTVQPDREDEVISRWLRDDDGRILGAVERALFSVAMDRGRGEKVSDQAETVRVLDALRRLALAEDQP